MALGDGSLQGRGAPSIAKLERNSQKPDSIYFSAAIRASRERSFQTKLKSCYREIQRASLLQIIEPPILFRGGAEAAGIPLQRRITLQTQVKKECPLRFNEAPRDINP